MSNSAIDGNCRDCAHNENTICVAISHFNAEMHDFTPSEGAEMSVSAYTDAGLNVEFRVADDFGCIKFVKREG